MRIRSLPQYDKLVDDVLNNTKTHKIVNRYEIITGFYMNKYPNKELIRVNAYIKRLAQKFNNKPFSELVLYLRHSDKLNGFKWEKYRHNTFDDMVLSFVGKSNVKHGVIKL